MLSTTFGCERKFKKHNLFLMWRCNLCDKTLRTSACRLRSAVRRHQKSRACRMAAMFDPPVFEPMADDLLGEGAYGKVYRNGTVAMKRFTMSAKDVDSSMITAMSQANAPNGIRASPCQSISASIGSKERPADTSGAPACWL